VRRIPKYARCTPLSCQPSRARNRRPATPAESPAAPLGVTFSGFYDAAIHGADDSDIAAARLAGISDLDFVENRSSAAVFLFRSLSFYRGALLDEKKWDVLTSR